MSLHPPPRIMITAGEPAGIGVDLVIELCQHAFEAELLVVGDPELILQRAKTLNRTSIVEHGSLSPKTSLHHPGVIKVLPVKTQAQVSCGELDRRNVAYVLQTLDTAVDACMQKNAHAMVTGPVHKGIINDAGILFSGHTEYLAKRTHSEFPVMMLETEGLRVALVTTHLPLSEVAKSINAELLQNVLNVLQADLQHRYRINTPKLYVAGLNPHAGEGGHLGCEEIEFIIPALETLRKQGMDIVGPLSADTMFSGDNLREADAFIAMYHDQGLPVLKYAGFGNAINVTLGLPIIRTSVDHGTALELAGTGKANVSSFRLAVEKAIELSLNQLHTPANRNAHSQ